MSNYQERLTQEIERVGITTLSKKLGIARNTLYNWSEKSNVPLDKLMAMGEHGLDVEFVISGNANPNVQYSEQDKKLMASIQALPPENKETAEKVIEGLSFVNNGYVKQVNIHHQSQGGFSEITFLIWSAICTGTGWLFFGLGMHQLPHSLDRLILCTIGLMSCVATFFLLVAAKSRKKPKVDAQGVVPL